MTKYVIWFILSPRSFVKMRRPNLTRNNMPQVYKENYMQTKLLIDQILYRENDEICMVIEQIF